MEYYEQHRERNEDVLEKNLKTDNYLHFKYRAQVDNEVSLRGNFYNTGLHSSDTSKLKLKVRHGPFVFQEQLNDLRGSTTRLFYDLERLVPNSKLEARLDGDINDLKMRRVKIQYIYEQEGKLASKTAIESGLTQETTRLYQKMSGSIYSRPTWFLGFGLAANFGLGTTKTSEFSLFRAGLSYVRPDQTHILEHVGDRDKLKWGTISYLGHKRLNDKTEFAVNISRNMASLSNSLEVGMRYQPQSNFVYRVKINDQLLGTSGFALRFHPLLQAMIACQHDFKNFSKGTEFQRGVLPHSPIQFKLVFGL